jgi:glucosamine--fructose-6-phosphate aminotransferase (isomerizing)
MDPRGAFTRAEIASQPAAWAATLGVMADQAGPVSDFFRRGGYDSLIFTGCGSTYYLSLAAAALAQELCGIPARGLPASELWLDLPNARRVGARPLLVAVSRSGETSETLRACAGFTAAGGDLLTLSCYPEAPLAGMGTLNLLITAGQEQSIAQTRAFSTLYLAATACAALWAGRVDLIEAMGGLPAVGERLIAGSRGLAQRLGADEGIDRFYFLGSGARYGLACELSLKMKEMSLSHSEPFHMLEFRHGPKSMVTPGALVVGLRSEAQAAQEGAVLEDMRAQGARLLVIGEDAADVAFESGLPAAVRNVLYLPAGQMLAFERSIARGLNPDLPENLDAVVKLG